MGEIGKIRMTGSHVLKGAGIEPTTSQSRGTYLSLKSTPFSFESYNLNYVIRRAPNHVSPFTQGDATLKTDWIERESHLIVFCPNLFWWMSFGISIWPRNYQTPFSFVVAWPRGSIHASHAATLGLSLSIFSFLKVSGCCYWVHDVLQRSFVLWNLTTGPNNVAILNSLRLYNTFG